MHRIFTIALCAVLGVCANAINVENGVSSELAEYRSANVKDVGYNLVFTLAPDNIGNIEVSFDETITFKWQGTQDLQIDYKRENGSIKCEVNGRKRTATIENEHIIISAGWLKKGINSIRIADKSDSKALNKNREYMYTLFVPDRARTVFPCFDQPDIKAIFTLTLVLPDEWKAMSNGAIENTEKEDEKGQRGRMKTIHFKPSERIPTYLFSFSAGRFFEKKAMRDGREIEALYRETDSAKVAQLDKVFDEIAFSLRWLEDYTGIRNPFSKYGIVILPGYQFGGMEHPGAIQLNDRTVFLGENPTPDDELKRFELIAHETAHLWFGDLVTMRWFNDVWTKEVFANLMAAKIAHKQFAEINHELNFLKSYQTRALSTDRTEGTHPIQQPLDNLNRAGLLYGNIIYMKAPVMMRKLEEQMGEDAFRDGLRTYLRRFSYANATWDNLISILDSAAPTAGIKDFSEVWVKQKGMPTITWSVDSVSNILTLKQADVYDRDIVWRQKFDVCITYIDTDKQGEKRVWNDIVDVDFRQKEAKIPLKGKVLTLFPNFSGKGYGRFLDKNIFDMENVADAADLQETNRYAYMMCLYENFLAHNVSSNHIAEKILTLLRKEKNPLIASTYVDYMMNIMRYMKADEAETCRHSLVLISNEHSVMAVRQKIRRAVYTSVGNEKSVNEVYNIWKAQSDTLLNARDYMAIAYHLAIMMPRIWQQITDEQRARLTNADMIREFDFISRACNPDTLVQQELFRSLLIKENREVEPWVCSMLSLLCHPSREPLSNGYIVPALDALQDIQRTGDIFFPGNWLASVFGGHKTKEAKGITEKWIKAHPDYPETLMNKVKENAFHLLNMQYDK